MFKYNLYLFEHDFKTLFKDRQHGFEVVNTGYIPHLKCENI